MVLDYADSVSGASTLGKGLPRVLFLRTWCMPLPARIFINVLLVVSFSACAQASWKEWQGATLEGEPFVLASQSASAVAINVYSPTCVPCIDELPALHVLARELQEKKAAPLYLLVDGHPEKHGLPADAPPQALVERLQQDVEKYRIELPMVVMGPAFRTAEPGAFITGTPETIFFKTNPLRPVYLFLGPIIESLPLAEGDSRFAFVRSQIDHL